MDLGFSLYPKSMKDIKYLPVHYYMYSQDQYKVLPATIISWKELKAEEPQKQVA